VADGRNTGLLSFGEAEEGSEEAEKEKEKAKRKGLTRMDCKLLRLGEWAGADQDSG
jgi:hypothetical protein